MYGGGVKPNAESPNHAGNLKFQLSYEDDPLCPSRYIIYLCTYVPELCPALISDEELHKLMDINKVFPKPPEVAAEIKRKRKERQTEHQPHLHRRRINTEEEEEEAKVVAAGWGT